MPARGTYVGEAAISVVVSGKCPGPCMSKNVRFRYLTQQNVQEFAAANSWN